MTNSNLTERLQQWYFSRCDGEWEHGFGPQISADSAIVPYWEVSFPIRASELGMLDQRETDDDAGWMHCSLTLSGAAKSNGLVVLIENVLSKFRPPTDAHPTAGPDAITELQNWYAGAIAGLSDEDRPRIRIETIDNPGWMLRATLPSFLKLGTDVYESEDEDDEDDWYHIKWSPGRFEAAAGPHHLSTIIWKLLELCR